MFAALIAREIGVGRNWRNLPVVIAVSLLVVAHAMIHMGAFGYAISEDAGKRLAIAVVVMLISLIGGRIDTVTPQECRNYFAEAGYNQT